MEKKEFINNDLKLKFKNHYIIFLGNVVGTSPYNMETLFLVTDLIQKNVGQVFYLEGAEEYREFWADRTFGKEIAIKGISPSSKKDSLKNLMKDFFITLPSTVVLNLPKSKESILISYFTKPKDTKLSPKYGISLERYFGTRCAEYL